MSDRADLGCGGAPAKELTVVVLGAGGLARRLAVGPLRECGLTVHDPHDADVLSEDGLRGPNAESGTGADIDLTTGTELTERSAAEAAGPSGPAVGLLVNPGSEHWAAATARKLPLVVLVLERPTDEGVVDAILRGADAVVTAHDEPEELVAAIEAVAAGGTLLTPHQARWVAEAARGRRREAAPVDALTRRELDILLSIDRGETVKQTARSLGISAKTVENLQSRLFRKLAVRNRAQAVSRAHALGLLSMATGSDAAAMIELTTTDGSLQARRPY